MNVFVDKSIQSNIIGFLSELYHSISLGVKSPEQNLEIGTLVISIDVDVGRKELGIINGGRNDSNIVEGNSEYLIGQIEERAFPIFIDLFNDFEIPVTFAVRGQLIELDDAVHELFQNSTVDHDIGAHGYYHKEFTTLTREEAEDELSKIQAGMRKSDIVPQSFVFPRNRVAYLDLLEKYGYKCYRSRGGFTRDCMLIKREGTLFNVHPSLYIGKGSNNHILKKILDMSIAKKLPFHIWFHLWNFGQSQDDISKCASKIFRPLLHYAKRSMQSGNLACETMLSATYRLKEYLKK
jgi:hypothetical protein